MFDVKQVIAGKDKADLPGITIETGIQDQTTNLQSVENIHNTLLNEGVWHDYITRDGVVHAGRPLHIVGAHATGYNAHSIGICYEGGLDIWGRPADTRTSEQKDTLLKLLERLKTDYLQIRVVGHRDLPGVKKDCPCFEV